jgi:hypothetical protein
MPNPDTNSIFYKIGQLTKQKIASEVANAVTGGGGGGGGTAGLPTDATVSVDIYPLVDLTDITVLTITVAGNFLASVDASDNTQNISVIKFDIVDETEAAALTRVASAGDTPAANEFIVHDDILYYVTDENEPNSIPSAASGATLYTDYNHSTPQVVNFSSVNLTVSEEGSDTAAILKDHLPNGPTRFSEPGTNLIDLDYKSRLSTYYHEISYTVDGDVDTIDVWLNNTKTTKLFTKAFTYTSGDLTQILITDVVTGATLTKQLVYNVDGNLKTVTRTYA